MLGPLHRWTSSDNSSDSEYTDYVIVVLGISDSPLGLGLASSKSAKINT